MYESFFGFQKKPFSLTPDPEFLYFSKVHDLALTHLEYGIISNAGFIAITGEVGCGKTTLIKYLFENIKKDFDIAIIFNTNVDSQTLLEMIAKEFELNLSSTKKSDLFEALANHFISQYSKGTRCVIIIDEAQNLPLESFEELRMLSNIEVDSHFISQIIFVGQPELREKLSHPALTQLSQRISVYFNITSLQLDEVKDYIDYRIKIAGYEKKDEIFTKDAIDFIAESSKGIPRIINLICDTALVYAFADNVKKVNLDIVKKAVTDNELLVSLIRSPKKEKKQKVELQKSDQTDLSSSYDIQKIKQIVIELQGRIDIIESKLKEYSDYQLKKFYDIFYTMLKKERETNIRLQKEILILKKKLNKYIQLYEAEKKKKEDLNKRRSRKIWEVFAFGK